MKLLLDPDKLIRDEDLSAAGQADEGKEEGEEEA